VLKTVPGLGNGGPANSGSLVGGTKGTGGAQTEGGWADTKPAGAVSEPPKKPRNPTSKTEADRCKRVMALPSILGKEVMI